MSEEIKRITVEDLYKVVEDVCMPVAYLNWNGLELAVKRNILLEDVIEFVTSVTSLCFEEETNRYMPEVKDFGIRAYLIDYYTNVDLPEDTGEKYSLLYETDLVQTVLNSIDMQQFNDIVRSIEESVSYIAKSNIDAVMKQIQEVSNLIEKFGSVFQESFGDLSQEDLAKVIGSITENDIDEEKLIQAYMSVKPEFNTTAKDGDK